MRFFLINSHIGEGRTKPLGVSILSSLLKRAGHKVEFVDLSTYEIEVHRNEDNPFKRNIDLQYRRVKDRHKLAERVPTTLNALKRLLKSRIEAFKPDLIGFSTMTWGYKIGSVFSEFFKKHFDIPIIFGGIHPTLMPEEVIENPYIDLICVGEGEKAILELANRIDNKEDINGIKNIWTKTGSRINKNPLNSLVDVNVLPFLDWDIYSDLQFWRPFDGKIYRMGDVQIGRGCPYGCSFCSESSYRNLYNAEKKYLRRKDAELAVEELFYLKDKYDIGLFRFWDESFLLNSDAYLDMFSERYRREVNLPCIIETTCNSINKNTIKFLKNINCVSVSMGIESGNEDYRRDILNKRFISQKIVIDSFRLLEKANIKSVSYNMVGLPYETKELVMDTVKLNKKARVHTPEYHIFFPFPGVELRDKSIREGLYKIENDDKYYTTQTVSLEFSNEYQQFLIRFFRTSILYHKLPKFLSPLIEYSAKDGFLPKIIKKILEFVTDMLRFRNFNVFRNSEKGLRW